MASSRLLVCAWLAGCAVPPDDAAAWIELFDGTDLGEWRITDFGAQGEVRVEDGRIILDVGDPLTGITWKGAVPTGDYELSVRAARLSGSDFFCGLTFPVGAAHCSLILGGWGGALTGLSCIDGADASRNETTGHRRFVPGRFYDIVVRVQQDRIVATVDGENVVDVAVAGRRLSVRPEVDLSRPLGIASFMTRAAIERVAWRAR